MRWQALTPAQREALAPLERDWPGIDAPRKQKWLAARRPLSRRCRPRSAPGSTTRMTEWARLTPAERGQARLRFQEARQVPAPDRQRTLAGLPGAAARAAAAARRPRRRGSRRRRREADLGAGPKAGRARATARRPRPTSCRTRHWRSRRGRSRRRWSRPRRARRRRLSPAGRRRRRTSRSGMPKIAATPEFVNRSTLLPQRGPQAAAVAPAPSAQPRLRAGHPARRQAGRADADSMTPRQRRHGAAGTPPRRRRRRCCGGWPASSTKRCCCSASALVPARARRRVLRPDRPAPSAAERRRRCAPSRSSSTASISSGCWSVRGQTLAMQTWRIRVVTADGARLSQARALARYVACCIAWFAPATLVAAALALAALAEPRRGRRSGSSSTRCSPWLAPERQFWHDSSVRHAPRRHRAASRRRRGR